ncbi:hypothetical protein SDC9_54452 [bioreactor metagenome]|uniref:SLH domain-containing protein n=1 Tax=bioreactor metagenome TaxID=1076179 RepID=A0A644WW67_9ZZZZ
MGYSYGSIENCYSLASVTGPYKVGGLIGRNASNATNCYSAGLVTGTGSAIEVGGLVGVVQSGTVTNCYWDVETSTKSSSAAGTGYLTAAMKTESTFADWDFSEVWSINTEDNSGYPALVWEDPDQTVSSDATLSGLAASGISLTPGFSSEITSYRADVINSIGSTTITATPSEAASAVSINGTAGTSKEVPLGVGSNTIIVSVTAEDGMTGEIYTVTINRASAVSTGGGTAYTPSIIVETTEEHGTTTNKTEISSTSANGTAASTITTAIADALLDKISSAGGSGKGDLIEVAVDSQDDIDKLNCSISQSDLKKIADETDASFAITSPFISVAFDGKALETISGAAAGGTVVITATIVDSGALSDEDREKVQGRPVYDFSVTNGGQQVSNFSGGTATVTIPYSLQPGEDPNAVVVYCLSDDGILQSVSGQYNAVAGTVVFTTPHFSKFVVGYNHITFSDVASDAWYYDAVTFCAAREITAGTGDGMFSPDVTLTRGQFMVMLMRAYGIGADENPMDNFDDAGDTYYTGYLAAAKELGISNGVGNNLFAPENGITRQEMFTLLYNTLSLLDRLPIGSSGKTVADFSDAGGIASWAQDAMTLFVGTGTVSGSGGMLNPAGTTTRAEMAQVIYNLLAD